MTVFMLIVHHKKVLTLNPASTNSTLQLILHNDEMYLIISLKEGQRYLEHKMLTSKINEKIGGNLRVDGLSHPKAHSLRSTRS